VRLEWEARLARVVSLTAEFDRQTVVVNQTTAALAHATADNTFETQYKEELWNKLFDASHELRCLSNIHQ